jgi:hypothetical protein
MLAGSLVFGARSPASEWTSSMTTLTAHWKGHAEFRYRFCFGLVGWLEATP